jgi:hypothetical protein
MPEEPTTNDAQDQPTPQLSPGTQEPGAAPPFGDDYRWHGPSRSSYPGAETQGPYGGQYGSYQASQSPYGTPQSPYGTPPQSPYGAPQSPPPYSWPYLPPQPPRPPLSPEERRRRTRRGFALAAALVLAVGAGIGIGAAIAPTSPATLASTLVNHAISSATKAGTYHYVELSSEAGAAADITGDAAPNGGQQVIDERCSPVQSGTTDRTGVFDLRLVDGVVYFRGNRVAVVDVLGVPVSRATSLVRKWVRVVKGQNPYKTFEVGITTSSNASQLRTAFIPTSSRNISASTPPSTDVVGALFTTPKTKQPAGTATLVLNTSNGRPRTLRGSAVYQDTERYTLTWTFDNYSEKVHVVAPPHPLSYSSLGAKPPPKNACV